MKKTIFLIFISLSFAFSNNHVLAQLDKINSYLKLAAQGKVNEIKPKVAELAANYSNEPGVMLLQGVIQDDGAKAVTYYQKIVDKYPNSEWADHAAWRLIQYYVIVEDTSAAVNSLNSFRKKYPNSEFLAPAADAVRMAISNAKYDNKENYDKQKKQEKAVAASNESNIVESKNKQDKQYYGLQVGIYSTKEAAESEKERFIKLKMRTEVKEKLVQGEKKYAVVIGNYSSEQAATEAKKIVEKECECIPLIYKK